MKKLLFILLISAFGGGALYAQPPGGNDDAATKAEIIKILIRREIIKRLDITPDEAQKFTPVFDKYQDEWFEAVKVNKNDVIKRTEEVLKIQKRFKPDFQRVLNSEDRANRVFKAHENVIDKIRDKAERMREKRQGGTPPPRGERRIGRNF